MAPPEHSPILKRSVTMWNAWREHNKDVRPDLSGATRREADLSGADLTDTTLSRTTRREADISRPRPVAAGPQNRGEAAGRSTASWLPYWALSEVTA